jgi:hypothetical protein
MRIRLNFLLAVLLLPALAFAQPKPATNSDAATNAPVAAQAGPRVDLHTSMGEIVVELYPDKAPKTVENFLNYVHEGFYNGTTFNRVIDDLLIQGGGYTADLQKKPAQTSPTTACPTSAARFPQRAAMVPSRRLRSSSSTSSTTPASTTCPKQTITPGAMRCLAKWCRAWTWWTRSAWSRRTDKGSSRPMCRLRRW